LGENRRLWRAVGSLRRKALQVGLPEALGFRIGPTQLDNRSPQLRGFVLAALYHFEQFIDLYLGPIDAFMMAFIQG